MGDVGRMADVSDAEVWLAGVDGCRGAWIAVFVRPEGQEGHVRVMNWFAELAAVPENPTIVAIDIPIGLPEHIGSGGRGPESAVRPLLGARQSSVFPVPSRAAIMGESYEAACRLALATSDPPRKISRQLFNIIPKIREVDGMLRHHPQLAKRTYEVHPEVAFWRLNGERPLAEPKKVKSRAYEPSLKLRRKLLLDAGMPCRLVENPPPEGAGPDDLLDALACAAIARRIHAGIARPFPNPPQSDAHGLPMAIWA